TNDNIVSYWIPRAVPPPGQPLEIAYRLSLQSNDPVASAMGRVTAMRIGNGDREDWKRVVVDYEGDKLSALAESTPVQAVIALGQDGQLVQQTVFRNAVTRGWRLSFQIKPVKGKPLELRAYLQNGKETLTETWSYQLEP
ncbi:MAG: glucan biosynthesis protein, partial [Candidatus Binatia bacterium]